MAVLHLDDAHLGLLGRLDLAFLGGRHGVLVGRQEEDGAPAEEQEVGVAHLQEVQACDYQKQKDGVQEEHDWLINLMRGYKYSNISLIFLPAQELRLADGDLELREGRVAGLHPGEAAHLAVQPRVHTDALNNASNKRRSIP